ncbi:MAG: divergent polysaccharide deacetylase family protein [Desulfobacterales bacterium]|nr:MAG: divergent polysaccharide deacetylase family protein [Desulfobacterales bacterium]
MAKKKPSQKKRPRKTASKTRKQNHLTTYLLKAFTGIGVLIVLVVLAALVAHHMISRKSPLEPVAKPQTINIPRFEIYPKEEIIPRKIIPKPTPTLPEQLPKIAIIVDDLGYDKYIVEKFLALDAALTFSVLPHIPYQKRIANAAFEKGFEIMLHLPMEPDEFPKIDPGPGALLSSMSPDELIDQLNKNIDTVPFVKGVNNHMGSKMTKISTQLYQIFSVLKKRNLFFIDSLTTTESLCKPSARLLRVPFAQRDVFLDHIQDPDFIHQQFNRLIQIAETHGEAIGIAHPYHVTFEVLSKLIPELKKKAILVPASEVVHIIG